MSRTQRNKPHGKLSEKEQKYVEKGKYKHGVHTKQNPYELEHSQSAKREEKRRKHKGERHNGDEDIVDQLEDKNLQEGE
jgi:hypothetical protein